MKRTNNTYCHPDLIKERSNCRFNQEEITNIIDGGIEKTKLRKKLGEYLNSNSYKNFFNLYIINKIKKNVLK